MSAGAVPGSSSVSDEAGAPETDATHAAAVRRLLDVLTLRRTGEDTFVAQHMPQPNGRVYGGQVLAQTLLAAGATVPDGREPHSLHGYFLRAGVPDVPLELTVERLRDGRSFSARRVHASQDGVPILSMITSFQVDQPGFDFADPMPDAPDPLSVASADDHLRGVDHPAARFLTDESAFEIRHVQAPVYLTPAEPSGRQLVWVRTREALPDDPLLHRAVLAYVCDQLILEPVLRRSGNSWVTPGMSLASLDHAMWWHRDVRVDEWLLFVQGSPSAQGGRGLGTARAHRADGAMVASIAQEGMVRVPPED